MTVGERELDQLLAVAAIIGRSAMREEREQARHGAAWLRWWSWCDDRGLDAAQSARSVDVVAEWLDSAEGEHSPKDVAATYSAIRMCDAQ